MQEIVALKASQTSQFVKALKESGTRRLVHDVPDEFWGAGRSGEGLNMMGEILEALRSTLHQTRDTTPLQTVHERQIGSIGHALSRSPVCQPSRKTDILLVGNSQVKDLAPKLYRHTGPDTIIKAIALSGANAKQIKDRIPFVHKGKCPKYVILHGLDINLHNNQPLESSLADYESLIAATTNQFPESQVMVCGIPDVNDRNRACATNFCVNQILPSYKQTLFVDTSGLRLHDGIHYSRHAKNILVERLVDLIHPNMKRF